MFTSSISALREGFIFFFFFYSFVVTVCSLWEISERHFKYPIVEQYLRTKRSCRNLTIKYVSCRLLTLTIVLSASAYLGYYISLSSLSDEFVCSIKSGILRNDSTIPDRFQCKLIAVGVFQLLSLINLVVYMLLAPVVIYTLFVPFRQKTDVLRVYEILPTFDVLHFKSEAYNDLSLYNLFLEENVSELKSYRCLKVLENIKSSGQGIDPMVLLTNLGMIKMDVMDGKKPEPMEMTTEEPGDPMTELKGRGSSWGALILGDRGKESMPPQISRGKCAFSRLSLLLGHALTVSAPGIHPCCPSRICLSCAAGFVPRLLGLSPLSSISLKRYRVR